MSSEISSERGVGIRAEWRDDEVVFRFPSLDRLMRAWLPDETVSHLQAARREQLLAVRAILDAAIARIDAGGTRIAARTGWRSGFRRG